MSALTVIKAFRKDAEYLPVPYPAVPSLPEKPHTESVKENFAHEFEKFEKETLEAKQINDDRFEVASTRMGLCAFLNGFMNPLGMPIKMRHFKWCPDDEWRSYSSDVSLRYGD